MAEKRMQGHPHHKGGGMAEFNQGHYSDKYGNLDAGDQKYCSDNPEKELRESVQKLNSYVKSHRPKR